MDSHPPRVKHCLHKPLHSALRALCSGVEWSVKELKTLLFVEELLLKQQKFLLGRLFA